MSTHTIAIEIKLGPNDTGASINRAVFEAVYSFQINEQVRQKNKISISKFYNTLRKLHLQPSELAMDLLVVACSAYAADTRINRYKHAQDGWTRQIKLFIPVSDSVTWESKKELLSSILQFLTGDFWEFEFRSRHASMAVFTPPHNRKASQLNYETNTVCLFSGGMDSFIGAFKLLNNGIRPLLVGHSKSADVSFFRNTAYNSLRDRFNSAPPLLIQAHVRVDKEENAKEKEDTERGRSFLFLVLGGICASALPGQAEERKKLIIPENGLISLNLPLTPLRLGAYSTRTTHPFLLKVVQELFNSLQLNVDVENPYELKTKGEMLRDSGDPQFIADVDTMSCSRPATRNAHLEGSGNKHCGRCVPCIIRRASLKKANIPDNNSTLPFRKQYRLDILNSTLNASINKGENVIAFKYFINRVNRQPNYLTAAIRMTGPLENVEDYISVYKRGLQEVEQLLANVQVID